MRRLSPEPTARQLECLALIARHMTEEGFPPTIRWLCDELRVSSPTAVVYQLTALERKGCIERTPLVARGLSITPLGRRALRTGKGVAP